jgi:hypothetical protein
MPVPQQLSEEWVDTETARAMLGGVAARTLRHMAAEGKIMRMVLPGPKQTRVYFKPDIERILAGRAPAPVARHKRDDQQVLTLLSQVLTQMRPADSPRPALHLALQEAAAYAGLPAPFLLRLVADRKLACWQTQGPSKSGEGYFFARADLEALQATLENAV